ncbi:hypothetical protein ACHAQJ_002192 [Trichoderma viride]
MASVAFSDDRMLISESRSGAIKAWDTITWEEIRDSRDRADSSTQSITIMADNHNLASKSRNYTIKDVQEAEIPAMA